MKYKKHHNLKPSFLSGDSSSSMLYEVLSDQSVAAAFVSKIFELKPIGPYSVYRDKRFGDAGNIDILIELQVAGRDSVVLVACEVNDYSFTSEGLLIRFYETAREEYQGKDVYLIYLTQFTDASIDDETRMLQPPTIKEFEQLRKHVGTSARISHISWQDFHALIKRSRVNLNSDLVSTLSIHSDWIKVKNREDVKARLIELA
jgi:hypothetical protein